jgi:ABC-type antimicrobial peptide transport system permease subunit
MDQIIWQLFHSFENAVPSRGLVASVFDCVSEARACRLRRILFLVCTGFLVSFFGVAWSVASFGGALFQSEFWNIGMLLFSDFGTVFEHWREFAFSLLETFPAWAFSVLSVSLLALFLLMERIIVMNLGGMLKNALFSEKKRIKFVQFF